MAKRVKREQFPWKQYQNPSQYYKCWLLKSFGLMLLLIEKFITHTSSASISNPHKNTKARPSKSKTCESGKMNPKLH